MNDDTQRREGGAWIGQHPDPNTVQVPESLDPGAERVAVTNNEPGDAPSDEGWPGGHRAGDDAGENG